MLSKHMLGENIKAARDAAGIKQAEFARQLGISPLRMWRYETNRARPSIEMLKQIASLAGVTVDALVAEQPTSRGAA